MRVLDLFSGIGGFSLGLERAGMETAAFCEFDEKARAVLTKHWPDVPIFNDVCELSGNMVSDIDVICGGFPCQDVSHAGKREGLDGDRSGLWGEYARLIGEIRPRYALIENVSALLVRGLDRVLCDLAALGYDAEWHCIRASNIGANHQRDRVWILAYPADREWFDEVRGPISERVGRITRGEPGDCAAGLNPTFSENELPNADSQGLQRRGQAILQKRHIAEGYSRSSGWWKTEPAICRVDDGVPRSSHRLKQLGNAVVPQIPEVIGRAIMEAVHAA